MQRHPEPRHPKGTAARVLLTSVYGPYARDDEDGSRAINPMELYHNQVTRAQDVFSLRMFHRSWGLMLIQANLEAPCTLLDFPTLERFVRELRTQRYDVVGISGILPNLAKVARMCALARELQPQATVVVGGHVANVPDVEQHLDADHVVRGEGVAWFRRFLGQDEQAPIRHPLIVSAIEARTMGLRLPEGRGETAATLIPSVGCPMGCDFCSTSAMFGGKGRHVDFYRTGEDLYGVMCGLERALGVSSFFVMDENFLLQRRRALDLLGHMRAGGKSWSLLVFSSANTLRLYSDEELIGLGVTWLWIGLEGQGSAYDKLRGADTRALVLRLQGLGIRVLGSTIVGLPEHTLGNIGPAIEHAVAHDTEFHQFMLYTPIPGTPLYRQHAQAGTLRVDVPPADTHGQLRFNYVHPHLPPGVETGLLRRAFERDFEVNGPSVLRIARTLLRGWRRLKDHPEARVRARLRRECRGLATGYAGGLWAAERWLAGKPALAARLRAVRQAIAEEFGWRSRLAAPVLGRLVLLALARERRRLERGRTYEPPTFYEANEGARSGRRGARPAPARWVPAEPLAD